ncbi:methyltransferase family protein [Burkholderia sp. Ch1-1]|nr:methyltransferase family protein [Burkholderia sp. Ch1-1]
MSFAKSVKRVFQRSPLDQPVACTAFEPELVETEETGSNASWPDSMLENWSTDKIQDPEYKVKFVDVPNIIAEWLGEHGGITGKDVLDFGCGEATMAVGVALRHGARRVVAVDVHPIINDALPLARAQLGLNRLPYNLEIKLVDPEASLEELGMFDVIYSWSVFEHVRQDLIVECLTKIKRALRPGGMMFLQTTPLFYSAFGSHFQQWIPEPWAHLSMQQDLLFARVRAKVQNDADYDSLMRTYETLNRATDTQIIRAIREAGFEIVKEHRTYDEYPIPPDLSEVYQEKVLRTQQLVFLAKHA